MKVFCFFLAGLALVPWVDFAIRKPNTFIAHLASYPYLTIFSATITVIGIAMFITMAYKSK